MKDHESYYETVCKDLFKEHGEKIDELRIVVKNGLTHRMKRVDKTVWLIIALLVGKWVSEFFV